jgi:hypothetical protein
MNFLIKHELMIIIMFMIVKVISLFLTRINMYKFY